jgi:hypothetical protein
VHDSKWVGLALLACLWAGAASAQLFHPISDSREIYARIEVRCIEPRESRSAPTAPFAAFGDTVWHFFSGCDTLSQAQAGAIQISGIVVDSLYVYDFLTASSEGASARLGLARSDASIGFRVEPDRRYRYDFAVAALGFGSGGVAILNASLSGAGPGGIVRDSLRMRAGPRDSDQSHTIYRHGFLESGDYTIEVHASAESEPGHGMRAREETWVFLKLFDATAAVPWSWERVKSLYR